MTERLTTLAAVKDWLGITGTESDTQLVMVIDAVSQFILNFLSWTSFQRMTYTQNFRGYGKGSVLLRNWPVLAVTSVATGGTAISASTFNNGMPNSGWYLGDQRGGPQSLDLMGYVFGQGVPSTVIYEAGFETTQTSTIPNATPWQITPTNSGVWSQDLGVTIDGVAATLVTGTPITGQYAVDEWGTYTFAEADAGKTAVMSYSYTPSSVSLAALEIVSEWIKRKDRIGILSKTLGGQETITFSQEDMVPAARSLLQSYMNVVPA